MIIHNHKYMAKFKVLGGEWGEGYLVGDVFEAPFHAMETRLEKGEVEEVKVVKKKKTKKA